LPPLKLVRDKPVKQGEQIARDANDTLSSFPDAKQERIYPEPKSKKPARRGLRKL
jgi:hypothetical protein